jgi:hypothetical protein
MKRWHYIAILLAAVPVAAWSFWGPGGMADGKVGPGVSGWTDPNQASLLHNIDFVTTNAQGMVESKNSVQYTNFPTLATGPAYTNFGNNVNGRAEHGYDFDGSDDYTMAGDVSDLDTMTNGFTICGWINRDNGDNTETIMAKYNAGGTARDFILYHTADGTGRLRLLIYSASGSSARIGRDGPDFNQAEGWVHVGAVWDGTAAASGISIYTNAGAGIVEIDDADSNSGTFVNMNNTAAAPIQIGDVPTFNIRFNGRLAAWRIYGTALSSAALQDIAQNTGPPPNNIETRP